jgi:hypothetical protein
MTTVPLLISFDARPLDENTLTWDHPVRILEIRGTLLDAIRGAAPAVVYADVPGRWDAEAGSLLFAPGAERGARRVARPAAPVALSTGEPLKVWGLRPGGGGRIRVEIDFESQTASQTARGRPREDRDGRCGRRAGG